MDGLDVEGLLAVPALRPARGLLVVAIRCGRVLGELAGREPGNPVLIRPAIRVALDRRRRVGVGDGDRHALAVETLGDAAGQPER